VIAFESILVLLMAAVVLAAVARRLKAPYPALLAVGGIALAFVPGAPAIVLDPQLALALFVAPVLLDAAYDASPRDLRRHWVAVASLAIGAVLLTTAAVAVVAHALVPGLSWAAAVALGAIVAPPDAAAATALLRQVRLPHRLVTILEGESLLNDATALLVYRLAVGAVLAGSFSAGDVGPAFLLGVAGSIAMGFLLSRLTLRFLIGFEDIPSSVILQFVSTFGVWILAERLHLSGVLTMVCYASLVARRAPDLIPARNRIPSYAVWDTVVFLLNVLAFVLIGLQVRPILHSLDDPAHGHYLTAAAATLLTAIVVRFAWVTVHTAIVRARGGSMSGDPARPALPTWRGAFIVAWCGMRGIVTLAAALALPAGFPQRDFIVLTAFCVVLGTLVVQGVTLRPLLLAVALPDDDLVGREFQRARALALEAAVASLEGDSSPEAEVVRREFAPNHVHASEADGAPSPEDALRQRAMSAARRAVSELRATDQIGDAAFHRVEEELDWAEMGHRAR
jgi:CPA1 family monovalent cation:H+ antiporter